MKEKVIIKYFDIILLTEKDDSLFNIYSLLIPEYFPKYDNSVSELRDRIKRFSELHGYFDFFPNGSCKLTKRGLKAKGKGGHLKLLEYEEHKEKKQDEILDLNLTLKRFESKIGMNFPEIG